MLKKKYRITFIIIPVIILAFILIVLEKQYLKENYLIIFKKSGEIYQLNEQGKFEGKSKIYINGIKTFDGNFKNGELDGWIKTYNTNGKITEKQFYRNGKLDGMEYRFYNNGKISFKGMWKKGESYGSQYNYKESGQLSTYSAFDINKMPNDFFAILYNDNGKPKQVLATFFSENFFTITKNIDTPQILIENQEYKNIEDLYITVATPPQLKPSIKIFINDKSFIFKDIKANTLKIKNAFDKAGEYKITVLGDLKNEVNKIINKDSVSIVIKKLK